MKKDISQIKVLTKHFIKSFFENEDLSMESRAWRKLLIILSLLGIISGFLTHSLLKPYLLNPDVGTSWIEKAFFITFFMILMGILSVLLWKNIFFDSRDYDQLSLLPIKTRTLFLSKFFSLFGLMSLFFLCTTLLSSFLFPLYLLDTDKLNIFSFLHFWGVHLASCFLACFFVFITSCLINGILRLSLSITLYNRISTYLQIFLLIVFSFAMIFFVAFFNLYQEIYSSFSSLQDNDPKIFFLIPPFWFVGLYESLLGNSHPLFSSLTKLALLMTLIIGILYLWITFLNFRNLKGNRAAIKVKEKSHQQNILIKKVFNKIFLRDSVQRGIFYFFLITLKRIKKYKLILGGYVAIPISLFFAVLMTLKFTSTFGSFLIYEKLVLTLPHILIVFLIMGARVLSNFPESLKANWIFRITESNNTENYLVGLKKGIFFLLILPSLVLLYIVYLFILPYKDASLYSLYSLINSLFLIEIVFFGYFKIPFASTYVSLKISAKMILVGVGLLSYIYAATVFGFYILKHPHLFLYYVVSMVLLFFVFKAVRTYLHKGKTRLLYEENSKLLSLDLD